MKAFASSLVTLNQMEARGIDDYDLGKVHDLDADSVVTKRGIVDKDKFYLPKNRAVRFDGHKFS